MFIYFLVRDNFSYGTALSRECITKAMVWCAHAQGGMCLICPQVTQFGISNGVSELIIAFVKATDFRYFYLNEIDRQFSKNCP